MVDLLRILLVLLVLSGCEIGDSLDPDVATNGLPVERLVDFSCGDSLVTTDLPARFPIAESRIAGIWDLLMACGDPGVCYGASQGGPNTSIAFEMSRTYYICIDDGEMSSGTYDFTDESSVPTLHLSGNPDFPESTFRVEFVSPDTMWMYYANAPGFYSQFAARTHD